MSGFPESKLEPIVGVVNDTEHTDSDQSESVLGEVNPQGSSPNSVGLSVGISLENPALSDRPEPCLDSLTLDDFLKVIGMRVRRQRTSQGMSRKRLAKISTVSERYLAQLEAGQGNISIVLLRKVTSAVDISLEQLMGSEVPEIAIGYNYTPPPSDSQQ